MKKLTGALTALVFVLVCGERTFAQGLVGQPPPRYGQSNVGEESKLEYPPYGGPETQTNSEQHPPGEEELRAEIKKMHADVERYREMKIRDDAAAAKWVGRFVSGFFLGGAVILLITVALRMRKDRIKNDRAVSAFTARLDRAMYGKK
jgi:hypothetical protein